MTSFARRFLFAAVWLSGALSLFACQSQSEGEYCDQLNGDTDCASGLQCSMAHICCVPGTTACNAPPVGAAGAGGSSVADAANHEAASEASSSSEAATSEAAPSEAAANDSAQTEASAMGETGTEAGTASAEAGDGAAE